MKQFSKVFLLSAVSLFVDSGNLTYASFEDDSSLLKSGIPTLHIHHTYTRHTLHRLDLSSQLFAKRTNNGVQIASVCFITDAGNCSGQEFGNLETPDGTNRPDYDTIPEQCRDAGYTKTSCPAGQHLVNPCPSDNRYYERCECDDDYSELCNETDQKGVGEACNGKYKECCNLCSAYPYPSVPAGYVSIGECDSCDGKRYQIKCDNKTYPINSNICGVYGGYGNTCTDDGGTYFEECKCPLNYEWSATALKCVCSSAFKYTCTGTGYAGGDGESCDGKYKACICAEGYSWDAATGKCLLSCANECSLTTCPSPFTCRYEECSKRYCKTGCEAGYDWDASTQTCTSQCPANYQYDEDNCPSSSHYHCNSSTCSGLYTDCYTLPTEQLIQLANITWVGSNNASYGNVNEGLCPETRRLASPLTKELAVSYWIRLDRLNATPNFKFYFQCLLPSTDKACIDFVESYRLSKDDKAVNLTQDMYCGNISMSNGTEFAEITINGNGHTLTFDRVGEEATFGGEILDNIRIIQNQLNSIHASTYDENESYINDLNYAYCQSLSPSEVFTGTSLKSNVYVQSETNISDEFGPLTILENATLATPYFRYVIVEDNATLNIKPHPTVKYQDKRSYNNHAVLKNNSTLNAKDFECVGCYGTYFGHNIMADIHGDNSTINICHTSTPGNSGGVGLGFPSGCKNVTINTNQEVNVFSSSKGLTSYGVIKIDCSDYIKVNIDTDICSKMNF